MYPGPDAPDLGRFVATLERELVARGNEVDLAVLDTRAGGKLRYLTLAQRTLRARRPDVVYAHFLVPSGLIAALAGRAPLVVTAHGRDARSSRFASACSSSAASGTTRSRGSSRTATCSASRACSSRSARHCSRR